MGCAYSNETKNTTGQEPTAPKSRMGEKLLVLPDKESTDNTIQFYNVTKCRMEGSVEIPLDDGVKSPGFTIAAHPKRPTLYVTGPDSDGVQKIYQLSLQGYNTELTESRATLPEDFLPCLSVVACLGEDEYLYVFNDSGESYRLDLTLNALERIEKPKGDGKTLKSVLVVKACLFMVVGESLWILDQTDLDCIWVSVMETGFPQGHCIVVGDHIYIINLNEDVVKRYATMKSQFEDIKEFDRQELQASISMTSIGLETLYFTEVELAENDENTKHVVLKEYDLSKHKVKKQGILKKCQQAHELGVCWA